MAPPLSVITSTDPNALGNFYKGAAFSAAAGAATAGVVLTGAVAIPEIVTLAGTSGAVTGTSLLQATAAYGGATLATLPAGVQAGLAYGGSALMLGGTAYGAVECANSGYNPNSAACTGLVGGYMADPIGFEQGLNSAADTLTDGAISLINSPTSQKIIGNVVDRLDYAYTQSGMAEKYSGNLYAFDPSFSPALSDDFINIRNVRDTYDRYGAALRAASEEKDLDQFYAIARELGYDPVELPIGSRIEVPTLDGKGSIQILDESNPVRIGTDNKLLVGYDEQGQINMADLCHDIGACALGGKITVNGGRIPIDIFNQVTNLSVGKVFPLQSLENATDLVGVYNGTKVIPDTVLFDSLVKSNGIPYNVIKYIP